MPFQYGDERSLTEASSVCIYIKTQHVKHLS